MNKQQELFEQFKKLEFRLNMLSCVIQNDFELIGNPSFDCWYNWCVDSQNYENDLRNLLNNVEDFLFKNMEAQK